MWTAKILIRLGRCPGWSESSLGAHVILLVLSCRSSYISLGLLNSCCIYAFLRIFNHTMLRYVLYMSQCKTTNNKMAWAKQRLRSGWASAQSDQSICCALSGWFLHVDREDSDQSGQMSVYTGRTGHFIGLVTQVISGVWSCTGLVIFGPGHVKMGLMAYVNNKGAEQPAHACSLISTFVVGCLDSMMSILTICKVSRF